MVPLPALAFELSTVLEPEQNDVLPVMLADGRVFTVTANAADVFEQPLLLATTTV